MANAIGSTPHSREWYGKHDWFDPTFPRMVWRTRLVRPHIPGNGMANTIGSTPHSREWYGEHDWFDPTFPRMVWQTRLVRPHIPGNGMANAIGLTPHSREWYGERDWFDPTFCTLGRVPSPSFARVVTLTADSSQFRPHFRPGESPTDLEGPPQGG